APKSEYTIPTTRYRAEIEFPANTEPADFTEVKPQPAHWPLSAMLVLTQLSVGLASSTFLLSADSNKTRWITLGFAFAGLAASGLHLGKPFRAWRALVNLRRSWLSREIAAFSLFAALVSANVFFSATTLSAAVVVSGLIAVFTSVMIYVDTRRVLWSPKETGIKFFGSTALLGLAATLMLTSFKAPLVVALILVSATKLAFEAKVFLRLRDDDWSLQKKSALLLCRNLKAVALARFLCGAIGGIFLPLLILEMQAPTFLAVAALGLCFAGELLERHLFFRAAVTPKMPGGVAA
ncbi:MAG: Fe-S-cluster-containing hydrogenase subunit, partial [Verrucomicrobiales bacterium]|nr:Fe-S-cluster-containing hydrogenase subunit [Verrucomicrobiales bacterium]